MKKLEELTLLLSNELSFIDLPASPSNLYDPLRYFLTLGGKRIRPILSLLGADLFGEKVNNAIPAALAVEVFHNFTLIHDDIMDEAPLRRNKATVHQKWNQNIAILSGDVLFVKAYQLIAKQDPKHLPDLIRLFNKTAIEVCEGQQMDMDFESREDVSISEYIEMIRLKTSVLLGCALELGAIIANASENDRKHLYDFGQHIGIAFQIQDDILDLYADPEKFGKQVGGDVIANKKTLLNIKGFDLANDQQKNELKSLYNSTDFKHKVDRTRDLYTLVGARTSCEEEMQKHYTCAMQALSEISVEKDKKSDLVQLADSLMVRIS